jgi:hypothetical protein
MSGTLANLCDVEHWNEEVGIMVCRIYKALFAFSLLGWCVVPDYRKCLDGIGRANATQGLDTRSSLP